MLRCGVPGCKVGEWAQSQVRGASSSLGVPAPPPGLNTCVTEVRKSHRFSDEMGWVRFTQKHESPRHLGPNRDQPCYLGSHRPPCWCLWSSPSSALGTVAFFEAQGWAVSVSAPRLQHWVSYLTQSGHATTHCSVSEYIW